MNDRNYYEILQISKTASPKVIKAAYKSLVKKYHPDSGEFPDGEMIGKINNAYDTLSDPEKRRLYDEALADGVYREYDHSSGDGIDTEAIRIVLAKVSRMYPEIIMDNNAFHYSSRTDLRKIPDFRYCCKCIDIPEEAGLYILYYKKSSSGLESTMAITDMGIFAYESREHTDGIIRWEEFKNKELRTCTGGIKIGSYEFACFDDTDLLAILKEIQRLFNSRTGSKSSEIDSEEIIKKKILHNGWTIIFSIGVPAFCYYKGWNNLFVKLLDACFVYWLCDFLCGVIDINDSDGEKSMYLKWVIYGLGILIWYILIK